MTLLKWALIAFVVSIIAGGLGFSGVASAAGSASRILFTIFFILIGLAILLVVLGVTIGHAVF